MIKKKILNFIYGHHIWVVVLSLFAIFCILSPQHAEEIFVKFLLDSEEYVFKIAGHPIVLGAVAGVVAGCLLAKGSKKNE
jgi:hypothetical protein